MRGLVSARILTILAGSLLVATFAAFADASEKDHANKKGLSGKADKNGDGLIGRAEFDAWRQTIFLRIDANGGQTISSDEWQAVDRMRWWDQTAANENNAANTALVPAGLNRHRRPAFGSAMTSRRPKLDPMP